MSDHAANVLIICSVVGLVISFIALIAWGERYEPRRVEEFVPPRLTSADLRITRQQAEREAGIYQLGADGNWYLAPEFHGTGRPQVLVVSTARPRRRLQPGEPTVDLLEPRRPPVPRRNPSDLSWGYRSLPNKPAPRVGYFSEQEWAQTLRGWS